MSLLPIGLHAEALTVLVVGAGGVGTRRALAFLDAGARVRVVDPSPSETLRNRPQPELELVERDFTDSDVDDADLAIAATSDPAVNARVVSAARARRRLANRADEPAAGTFDLLAIHRAGAVTIGVSSGGVPQAAGRIRDALAQRFDSRYGAALERVARIRAQLIPTGEWPRAADSLVGEDFCDLVETGKMDERLGTWA